MIELIQVGFHGAAIAMAILAFRLLNKIVEDKKSNQYKVLDPILKTVRVFMGLCFALFLTGVCAQLYTSRPGKSMANITVTPASLFGNSARYENTVLVSHGMEDVVLKKGGRSQIQVEDKDNIRFSVDELVDRYEGLDRSYKELISQYAIKGGFGK